MRHLKLDIPKDLAVVCFDDHDLFRLYSPAITAVAQPIEEMSNKIIEVLLENIEKVSERVKCKNFVLPATLIVRPSTRAKASMPQSL